MSDEGDPAGILKDEDAVVFWNVRDYPISGVDHESVILKIKETLSVCPNVLIHAYVNNLSDELRHKYEDAQIIIHDLSIGENANWQILADIYMWVMRRHRSNLIVLSKHFTEDHMIGKLVALHETRRYCVFFSETGCEDGCDLLSNSFLTSLFSETPPADHHDLTLKSQTVSTNSFSMSNSLGDFPYVPHPRYGYAYTCIYLVMDDLSILYNRKDVLSLRRKLEKALRKKGYGRCDVCWSHFLNSVIEGVGFTMKEANASYDYYHWGFERVGYNNGVGFDKPVSEILLMVSIKKEEPLNLLILSSNEKFLRGTRRLAEVARFLKKNCRCNVVIAHIDQLLQGVEDQSGMEADDLPNYVTQLPPP